MSDEQATGSTSAQAGETQVAGVQPGTGEAAPPGQPETQAEVEYTFTMPEGVEVDKSRLDAFTAMAKEAKLPADVAQKLVGMEAARIQAEAAAHATLVQGWGEALSADPVLGIPENQAIAKSVIDKFGTPEVKAYLNETGQGNNPALVKMFYTIGKAMSEDGFIKGGDAPAETSLAKKMFPTMN